jgi:plastocyanin
MFRFLSFLTILALVVAPMAGCGGDPKTSERGVRKYGIPEDPLEGEGGEVVEVGEAPTPAPSERPVADAGRENGPARPAPRGPSRPARGGRYKVVEVSNGGTIRGTCKLSKAVQVPNVPISKDEEKCKHDSHPSERIVFDAGTLGLANCLVYLDIAEGKDWEGDMAKDERKAVLDQKQCVYIPHVMVVRNETQLEVWNSDPAEHNIHGYKNNELQTQFNFGTAPGQKMPEVAEAFLEDPAKYIVKCDIHPWMNAYVHAVTHPYHAVTDEKGAFELTNVPPGTYTIRCWHEGMQMKAQVGSDGAIASYTFSTDVQLDSKVTVEEGKDATVDFEIPAP